MNKTIKVIDLLNMIAKGEEVPKKIKCQNCIWKYEEEFKQYKDEDFRELVKALLGYYQKEAISFTLYGALTCKVEIIEEQPEIDIQSIEELNKQKETNIWAKMSDCEDKINEVIRAVKQLDNQINNK